MKSLIPWLIIALSIRLILIPISIHPDIRAINLGAYLISQKGELLTFYDHLRLLPRNDPLVHLYSDGLFIYPPLAYITPALYMFLTSFIYPWQIFHQLIIDIGQTQGNPQLYLLLYLYKLPFLIIDISGLFIISKLLEPKKVFFGQLIWLFNPMILYSAYMVGQFDIYISFFLLLAIYALSIKNYSLSAIFITIASLYKPFPLFLLPLIPGSKIKNIILGAGIYILCISPYLGSIGFRQYALLAPQTDKMTFSKIMVSGSQSIVLFYLMLVVIYGWNIYRKLDLPEWVWLSLPLFLFYSITHFHPQWFTWASPFLILMILKYPQLIKPILITIGIYIILVLFFEPSLNFGLVGINFSFSDFVSKFYPPDQLASIARSIFAAMSLIIIWQIKQCKQLDK